MQLRSMLQAACAMAALGVGTAIALPCIWALSRLVRAQLFGVDTIDAPTIAAAGGVLALVAIAGAMLPAWRAASVKPTEALRAELAARTPSSTVSATRHSSMVISKSAAARPSPRRLPPLAGRLID